MNVQDTVAAMIRAYPSLYRTRAMALENLFDSHYAEWREGALVYLEPLGPYRPGYSAKEIEDARPDSRLHMLQENAQYAFIHEHADLLAAPFGRSFDSHTRIRFSGRHFDDLPADVAPEWLEAARELAVDIVTHKYWPNRELDPRFDQSAQEEHDKSVALCKQFLERLTPEAPPSPYERASRALQLQREALALGMVLTEADGSPPRTSAF